MRDLYVVSGRLADVHRFINVPLHWLEQYPARERRELWIATPAGQEVKLVVHSRSMPARCGHAVEAVLCNGAMVGLVNTSTGAQVNYVRDDPPLTWRHVDSAVLAMSWLAAFVVAIVLGWAWTSFALSLGVIVGLAGAWLKRVTWNARLKGRVDVALDTLTSRCAPHARLSRVK